MTQVIVFGPGFWSKTRTKNVDNAKIFKTSTNYSNVCGYQQRNTKYYPLNFTMPKQKCIIPMHNENIFGYRDHQRIDMDYPSIEKYGE